MLLMLRDESSGGVTAGPVALLQVLGKDDDVSFICER